ncbi:MAG TPA: N-acetyl-gamma-glutamyl-phosphate reductase [Polyangia bacterium]|jgi:N-acetyl-gamma-glutamyl-phosphate reductase|nr:N-acetyl-gamma-glutamyl-phosphate reductase [Polyangia bacterium]
MKRFKAAVIGGSGYGGAEMIRRLLIHPDVELVRVASVDFVGQPLGAAHLSLTGRTSLRFEDLPPGEAAKGCDVALMGLPHKISAQKAPEILATGAMIVDMSGDFRLTDAAAYRQFYGAVHPHPELLGTFVYGLPELNRATIKNARAVASPGCFATTIILALLPLARAGKLRGPVHVLGITGSSGSGAVPSLGTHHPLRALNLKTYKALEHQHTPEIMQALTQAGGGDFDLRFVPVSAPLSRGILATSFVEVPASETIDSLAALFAAAYDGEPFVRFVRDRLPEVIAVSGSNFAEVGFTMGPPTGGTRTLAIVSATDNLIKGGAGQAIQNMNLMLGLPETTSLEDPGPWP